MANKSVSKVPQGAHQNGKGDKDRTSNRAKYRENWEKIYKRK